MTTVHPPPGAAGPPTADQTDADVIRRSIGDAERFEVIFDRYFVTIHRYVTARLGHSAADDVAAEVLLAAFNGRARYDQAQPQARAWLYGIATNLIHRHWRSEERRLRAQSHAATDEFESGHEDRVAERVSAADSRPLLASALAGLSQGDRDVVLLAASDLAYDEIAHALGIPAGTVASRLNRARKHLRTELGAHHG